MTREITWSGYFLGAFIMFGCVILPMMYFILLLFYRIVYRRNKRRTNINRRD